MRSVAGVSSRIVYFEGRCYFRNGGYWVVLRKGFVFFYYGFLERFLGRRFSFFIWKIGAWVLVFREGFVLGRGTGVEGVLFVYSRFRRSSFGRRFIISCGRCFLVFRRCFRVFGLFRCVFVFDGFGFFAGFSYWSCFEFVFFFVALVDGERSVYRLYGFGRGVGYVFGYFYYLVLLL